MRFTPGRNRRMFAVGLAAAMATMLTGVGTSSATTPPSQSAGPAKDPVMGGTLVVAGDAEVTNPWTPKAMQCDSYCQQRARTFYDPLVAVGSDNLPHPFLAESVTPNADFTEWTIKVRSGIKFHDGTPLNADAVIRNLQEGSSGFLLRSVLVDMAKIPAPTDADPNATALKIDKLDDMTLKMYTGKGGDPAQPIPWPAFPYQLSTQLGLIASPKFLDDVAAGGDATKAVGTGPFILQSYTPRGSLVVTRNPDYWLKDAAGRQLPYLDKIEFRVIEDSETSATALETGDIQAFSTSASAVVADFRDRADEFPMESQDQRTETNYGLINLERLSPLLDKRVRCALNMAIDRDEYVEALDAGITTKANGLFSPGEQGYLEDNGFSFEQNVAEAKRLIDEYEAETGVQVAVKWGTVNSQMNAERANLMIGWWKEIGVDASWEQIPQDALITTALLGRYDILGWRQHAGNLVDQQSIWWNSNSAYPLEQLSLNFARLRDPVIDENLNTARTTTDEAKATAAAEAINRQMAAECYNIPLTYTTWGTPHIKALTGFGATPLPDGTGTALDGAGFPGSFWTQTLWIDPEA